MTCGRSHQTCELQPFCKKGGKKWGKKAPTGWFEFLLSWAQVPRAPQKLFNQQLSECRAVWEWIRSRSCAAVREHGRLCCRAGSLAVSKLCPDISFPSALVLVLPLLLNLCKSLQCKASLGSESADLMLSWEFVPQVSVPWVLYAALFLRRSFF